MLVLGATLRFFWFVYWITLYRLSSVTSASRNGRSFIDALILEMWLKLNESKINLIEGLVEVGGDPSFAKRKAKVPSGLAINLTLEVSSLRLEKLNSWIKEHQLASVKSQEGKLLIRPAWPAWSGPFKYLIVPPLTRSPWFVMSNA